MENLRAVFIRELIQGPLKARTPGLERSCRNIILQQLVVDDIDDSRDQGLDVFGSRNEGFDVICYLGGKY